MPEVQFETWTTDDLAGQCRMQARELLDPEHSAFMLAVSARLTALATAVARARREALEEAKAVVKVMTEKHGDAVGDAYTCGTWDQGVRIQMHIDKLLAATPPEARQTETAWKPMDTAPKDGRTILACRYNGCGWGFHLVRWQSGKHGYPWQSATDDNAFPEGRLDYWQPVDDPPKARQTEANP